MSNMPLHVDHASLAKGSSDMREAIEATRAKLANVRSEVAASTAFWAGSAAGSFGGVMQEYDRKAQKLQEVLNTISDLVQKTNTNHQVNEEEQQRNMNSLMSALMG
ncbi:WXG100 family type VII secretion target [Stackebrandtia soli]|uniref:WXG100 family type VII secretion target n=1 Tax=Stackebrandtia soli TaxID=1892856 RepID=UPI0039E9E2EB